MDNYGDYVYKTWKIWLIIVSFVFMDVKNDIKKNNREKGNRGEDVACFYLKKHGFLIQERNYLRKWGEIDIIAVKDKILHFVEVKSVVNKGNIGHRPEENVHELKLRKLRRVIQSYLSDHHYGVDAEFKFHVITVVYDQLKDKFSVKMLENIIL